MKNILLITLATEVKELAGELRLALPNYKVEVAVLRHKDSLTVSADTIAVPLFVYEGDMYQSVVNSLNCAFVMPPLIYDSRSFKEIKEAVGGGDDTIYCVHNTELDFTAITGNALLWKTGDNTDSLTVELKRRGIKRVRLQPLMLERGFHFKRDVLGTLQPLLEKSGIEAVDGKGLMEYEKVRQLIIKRIVNFK
jgi:cobalamin biosynthesis Co2+ chelatase CbiK